MDFSIKTLNIGTSHPESASLFFLSAPFPLAMPFFDLQEQLGIDVDRWFLIQSGKQPYKRAGLCHAFEKEWLECAEGIGRTRAVKECKLEMDDLHECINRHKMVRRLGGTGCPTFVVRVFELIVDSWLWLCLRVHLYLVWAVVQPKLLLNVGMVVDFRVP